LFSQTREERKKEGREEKRLAEQTKSKICSRPQKKSPREEERSENFVHSSAAACLLLLDR
jgi:hypothetical protein